MSQLGEVTALDESSGRRVGDVDLHAERRALQRPGSGSLRGEVHESAERSRSLAERSGSPRRTFVSLRERSVSLPGEAVWVAPLPLFLAGNGKSHAQVFAEQE
jgi:hypothetical protein